MPIREDLPPDGYYRAWDGSLQPEIGSIRGLPSNREAFRQSFDFTNPRGEPGQAAATAARALVEPYIDKRKAEYVNSNASDFTISGPLGELEKTDLTGDNNFNLPLEYPLGLQSDNRFAHAMKISIFKPETSSYNITTETSALTKTEIPSAASRNRATFGQNIVGQNLGAGPTSDGNLKNEGIVGGLVGIQTGLNAYSAGVRAGSIGAGITAFAAGGQGALLAGGLTYLLEKNINLDRKAKKLAQNIYLYTPQQVIFTQQHKYSEQSATAALGALGYVAQGGQQISATGDNGNLEVGRLINTISTAAKGPFGEELKNLLVGNAARSLGIIGEGAQDLMLQSQGYAQNPQMEVLFDTTDFRQFTFEFDFMPRSEKESLQVLRIIKNLRFYSAPELYRAKGGGGSRYFIPPYYFEIEFLQKFSGSLQINNNIPKITTCVLEQIDIDYVGESDRFVSHRDGVPVHMKMTLRFKEIEIIHKGLVEAGY